MTMKRTIDSEVVVLGDRFYCKGKQLSDYLIKHGSKFIGTENVNGVLCYVFESDDTIDDNLNRFEIDRKRCMF